MNYLKIIFIFLSSYLFFISNEIKAQSPEPSYTKVEDIFTGSYINTNIAREDAIFTSHGYQYISYYDTQGRIVVGKRQQGESEFATHKIKPIYKVDLANPHNYISMQIDSQGYLHLAYGQHNSRINYLMSAKPYTIDEWVTTKNSFTGKFNTGNITYVRFFNVKGSFFVTFRRGSHGFGDKVLLRYDCDRKDWEAIHDPFITNEGTASAYLWRPVISRDGIIHFFWTWRLSSYENAQENPLLKESFSGFVNTDIYYARSADGGKTWTNSQGKAYKMPIKRNNDVELVENIPVGEDFFNHFGTDIDERGNIYIVYSRWGDTQNRIAQQWLTYLTGKEWKSHRVTEYKKPISWTKPQQDGRASPDLGRPNVAVKPDGSIIVMSRSKETGNVLEFYISEGTDYTKWRREVVFNGSLGGWEPLYDTELWHSKGELDLLLVGVTDTIVHEYYAELNSVPRFTKLREDFIKNFQRFISAMQVRYLGATVHNVDYYSLDTTVEVMEVDKRFKQDDGYILQLKEF